MLRRTHITAVVLLLPVILAAPAQDPDPKAEKVADIFHQLQVADETGEGKGRRYEISQDELNAYLAAMIRQKPQQGVEGIELELQQEGLRSRIKVNLDEIPLENGAASGLFRILLSGRKTLHVDGTLKGSNGTGSFQVREVWLGSIPLPSSLANSLLKSMGEKQDPPFDPTESFQLAYGIQSLEILPGKAVLTN